VTSQLEQLKQMRDEAQQKLERSPEYIIIQNLTPLIEQLENLSPLTADPSPQPMPVAPDHVVETVEVAQEIPPVENIETPVEHVEAAVEYVEAPVENIETRQESVIVEDDPMPADNTIQAIEPTPTFNSSENLQENNYDDDDDDEEEESLAETLKRLSQTLEGS